MNAWPLPSNDFNANVKWSIALNLILQILKKIFEIKVGPWQSFLWCNIQLSISTFFFIHDKKKYFFLNFWTRLMQSCKTEKNILRKLSLPGCVILHLVPVISLSFWLCCCSSQKCKLFEEHQVVIAQWLAKAACCWWGPGFKFWQGRKFN